MQRCEQRSRPSKTLDSRVGSRADKNGEYTPQRLKLVGLQRSPKEARNSP
jgi:hypothetical protein